MPNFTFDFVDETRLRLRIFLSHSLGSQKAREETSCSFRCCKYMRTYTRIICKLTDIPTRSLTSTALQLNTQSQSEEEARQLSPHNKNIGQLFSHNQSSDLFCCETWCDRDVSCGGRLQCVCTKKLIKYFFFLKG